MGADEYETAAQIAHDHSTGCPILGVEEGVVIERAIVDKNVHIGRGARIVNECGSESSEENDQFMICDGIAMIQKGAVLPSGWRLPV
jgi:glucose-1-phosphate adenylyltransferase